MKLAKQLGVATAGIALSFTAIGVKPADAAFVGPYDLSKWTLVNREADGFVDTSGSPEQIQLFSGNNGSTNFGTTDYLVKAPVDGKLSFKWDYATEDDYAFYDAFSFVKNGSIQDIFFDIAQSGQGTFTTTVAQGDLFGFRLETLDNIAGRGNVTISNFSAPVPEPFTVGGSLVACGFGLWMKRKQAASQKVS
jgi:hypothetical protein